MKITLETLGLDHLVARFRKLQDPDARGLMERFKDLITSSNRRGAIQGTDKDDVPLVPVTYRPVEDFVTHRKRGKTGPFGGLSAPMFGNLSTEEYRHLTGAPLAPRGLDSRIVTNLKTEWDHPTPTEWMAYGAWDEVYARDGQTEFLVFHFDGESPLPKRDYRGVRPPEFEEAKESAKAWLMDAVRSGGV
jgi:hypothetical protein